MSDVITDWSYYDPDLIYYDLMFNTTGYDFSFVVTAVLVYKDQHILD